MDFVVKDQFIDRDDGNHLLTTAKPEGVARSRARSAAERSSRPLTLSPFPATRSLQKNSLRAEMFFTNMRQLS
jgi:hypothetical protein